MSWDPYGNPMVPFSATYHIPPTKFYVVDTYNFNNQTFEYGADGSSLASQSWSLVTTDNNATPRGVTADASGTTIWVLYRDFQIYVYDPDGQSRGIWTAQGGRGDATGIATDGTDIWIVDPVKDQVTRYSGAATRISGTQRPSSSFSVAADSPQGITTDGTTIWIVDSSATSVYMYTMAGVLTGQWPLHSANTFPTGLTIDPTGQSDSVWVVDLGTTAVYQVQRDTGTVLGLLCAWIRLPATPHPQDIVDPPSPALRSRRACPPETTHRSAPRVETTLTRSEHDHQHPDILSPAVADGLRGATSIEYTTPRRAVGPAATRTAVFAGRSHRAESALNLENQVWRAPRTAGRHRRFSRRR